MPPLSPTLPRVSTVLEAIHCMCDGLCSNAVRCKSRESIKAENVPYTEMFSRSKYSGVGPKKTISWGKKFAESKFKTQYKDTLG